MVVMILCLTCLCSGQDLDEIFKKAAKLPVEEQSDFIRKAHYEQMVEKRLREFSAKVDKDYTPFFKDLGLSDEQSNHFKLARVELLRLAIEDGDPRQEFFVQRLSYDQDVIAAMNKKFLANYDQNALTKRAPNSVDVTIWADDKDEEHEVLYSVWDVPKADIESLRTKRRNLHLKAKALKAPREALIQARSDYLENLKAVIGNKGFAAYRRWELTKPAQLIFDAISKRTTEVNIDLLKKYETTVVDLIREANFNLFQNWHCPLRELPSPVVGLNMLNLKAKTDLMEFEKSMDRLFTLADLQQVPEPLVLELRGYFLGKLNEIQLRIFTENEMEIGNHLIERFEPGTFE